MKRDLGLFIILVTMFFSVFCFTNKIFVTTVEATYVEGLIAEDTVWTIIDSPFVASNDIIVCPNVTLTIEPGVEVKFGGFFSLAVLGKLHVNGTEKPIKFTSNREQPEAGDWGTLRFEGTEKSMLVRCSLAYATNGITIENGDVEIRNTNISLCSHNGILVENGRLRIQKSRVSFCSQNGIASVDGELTVQDNVIVDNIDNGIVITGNKQVDISGNTIISNDNGILLTGNEASSASISQNTISANRQNGIQIDAGNHTNLTILYNNISSNHKGFYISSPKTTYITNNSLAYNDIGIFYDEGNHTASFNDIYGNEVGMDVTFSANVSAEYNYWGHESGPYHEVLNPGGKGNPVGGDAVNLDFMFFLTQPFGYINIRPVATLLTDKTIVPPNETVIFFATNSFDEGRIDRCLFDFGDGQISKWTTLSVYTHKYSVENNYTASVAVMDDYGAVSAYNATVMIQVKDLPPLSVNVDVSDHILYEGDQISVNIHVTNGTHAMENAAVSLFSLNGGILTDSTGYTDSAGFFTTTFIASDVTRRTNVRIVATASKSGYSDGSNYENLEFLPSLFVDVVADPSRIKSEETGLITILVKSDEQPVPEADVSIYSDKGNLSITEGITDSDGIVLVDFTAPQTTAFLNVTITAAATKDGYMNGVGAAVVTVEPKVLAVYITAEPNVTTSEATVGVTVNVEYNLPISNANVTLLSEDFSMNGLTDLSGRASFTFTAPQVNTPTNITITAVATKDGYGDGQDQFKITVNPGQLDVQVQVADDVVDSEGSTVVTVDVTSYGTPVADALVTLSSTGGSFSVLTNTTESDGCCTFVFNAPRTTAQLTLTIAANVSKDGYIDGLNQTTITVAPGIIPGPVGELPLTTILLIVIPIVTAVIIVVLFKLGIVRFSSEEEE